MNMEYHENKRIPTIQHLLPSLEEIDFNLTKTALSGKQIESLTYTVSLEKISNQVIQAQEKIPFSIKPQPIECRKYLDEKEMSRMRESCRAKAITYRQKIKSKNLRIKVQNHTQRQLSTVAKQTIADLPTASTFFHISPQKPQRKTISTLKESSHKNKTSFFHQPKKSILSLRQGELQKYFPYFPKNKIKSLLNSSKKQPIVQEISCISKKMSIRSKIMGKIR